MSYTAAISAKNIMRKYLMWSKARFSWLIIKLFIVKVKRIDHQDIYDCVTVRGGWGEVGVG